MSSTKNLSVFLNETFVGELTQFLDGRTLLTFADSYLTATDRPVLSLSYKNVLSDISVNKPSMGLPPFFSHLLPEGRLRKYLALKAGVKETQEFRLLTALSEDLPGAVILKSDTALANRSDLVENDVDPESIAEQPLRFSLAGVQMKFSGNLSDDRVIVPASGVGGHWIVKLPAPNYPHVVELEYAMLFLAKQIGIIVPEFRLVPTHEIENLPKDIPEALQGDALMSKRFDRTSGGGRIHMEDFAQIFAVQEKYDPKFNHQSIANVISHEIGIDAVLEYVRRLVHMVLTGNADMHLKNWSLIYPDGVHAKLAPAYDFVSTIVYGDISKSLPHKIAGISEFNKIDIDSFRNLAKIANLPERPVVNCVIETVDLIKDNWTRIKNDMPIQGSFISLIDEHMRSVPLSSERLTSIPLSAPVPANMTWPGSFVNWRIELDNNVPDEKIIYKNQIGASFELDAPRRMNQVLIQKQAHEVLKTREDFANQLIVGYVSERLYDDWRRETFVRIESRMVEGGITQEMLQQPELNMKVAFFPVDWREIQKHFQQGDQLVELDFALENGELWGSQVTIASLAKPQIAQTGSRLADLRLYVRNSSKLYVLPPEKRLLYGSGRFSFSQANLNRLISKSDEESAT